MDEQLKLLYRPLPPKLPSKWSTPREKQAGQYLTRVIKSANDENGKGVPGSYVSAQGQVKQTDASLRNDHISPSPVQIQPKEDTCLSVHQICHGQTQIQLKDPLVQTQVQPGSTQPCFDHISSCPVCFQHGHAYLLSQDSNHGQIQFQPKITGFHDLRRGLPLSEASFLTEKVEQKGDRYSSGLVHKNNDPACWSLPGITSSRVDHYGIIPVYSSSQMPNQSKEKNIFAVQTPRRDFITKNPSGPDSFPSCKNHRFSHMKYRELQSTGPTHFTSIFRLESLAAGSSFHPLPLKTTLTKPLVSHCNCEVLSSWLMTKKMSLQTEVNTVIFVQY